MKKHKSNDNKVPIDVKAKLNDEKWLKKELAKGKTAQEILEISDEEVEEFYQAARFFFEKEKYEDAANTYHFLVTLNPGNNEYWLGLAMSAQMCGDFEGALDAYEMTAFNEIESPIPYFFLAQCLFALHDSENAILALDLAVEIAADNSEFADLKRQAIKAKDFFLDRK